MIARLRALFHRRELERDLAAELDHHLALKRLELGDPKALGNRTYWQEETYRLWTFGGLENLWLDLRRAAQSLARDRAFSLVALATLALGIGATTAIFSLLNGLLWRPLPVPHPEELVRIADAAGERRSISYPAYQELLAKQRVFSGVFGLGGIGDFHFEHNGVPRRAGVRTVTGSYFPVLGVQPQRGRLFTARDDMAGGPSTGWPAVISASFWETAFARSPQAIGAAISIERVPFVVTGIAPPEFTGTAPGAGTDLWIPLAALQTIYPHFRWLTNRDAPVVIPMARLTPGVSFAQAAAHLAVIAPEYALRSGSSGYSTAAAAFRNPLTILLAAVGAVLLIAATNLTNLFLARASARRHELALRLSLGAPVRRIRRSVLFESALLAASGTLLGFVLAHWAQRLLQGAASTADSPVAVNAALDVRVFLFLAIVLAAVVLVSGLAPAIAAGRTPPHLALQDRGAGLSSQRLRAGLIVAQTALSFTLLTGAGLMIASLRALIAQDAGLARQTLFVSPDLINAGVTRPRLGAVYESILAEVRGLPGVVSAAWTGTVPLAGGFSSFNVEVEGRPDLDILSRRLSEHYIGESYFSAAGLAIVAGADLPPAASARRNVAVISENAARRFFGSAAAAVGRRVKPGSLPWTAIVGVAANARNHKLRDSAPPTLYLPYWNESPRAGLSLAIRFQAGAESAPLAPVERALAKAAGRLPYIRVHTIEGGVREEIRVERMLGGLLAAFALFSLLISATGLAGLLFYSVERRRRELGIRLALGATASRIRLEIQARGLTLVAAGLGCGAILAWALRRSLNAYLYGVSAGHPAAWAGAAAALLLASWAATLPPARRAAKIDPAAMLRRD